MKPDAKDLFAYALELTGEDREAYLRDACGNDAELRLEVQNLLVKAAKADSFFGDDDGATLGAEEFKETYAEKEGDTVGPFKLRQPIGEGGFGSVWMAEQSVPISRMVALKVIKAGMDTKQVLARFEAERQALAMMDHPNIAKVLDAGATATGRPWFAMELVKGIPITEYCDQAGLGTRERLALFGDVCSAINHAHQKGIIHRDIKPSNVMVTLHGDKPVVKVIDFGIAKATQGKLTDQTLFTRFEQFIGTPVYMSPEQAAMSGLDIDTRSDIYALGILLYELLVGRPPFDAKSLVSAGYDEMRRIIREVEPPRPSSRLSTVVGEERTELAKTHHIDEAKLNKLVEPDLDWIVMKAIDKDRTRRYETANAFAQDIVRFLSDQPVTATPPSTGYQFKKFARRNKAVLRLASAIAAVLVAATLVSSFQALRATRAEKQATTEASRAHEAELQAKAEAIRATQAEAHAVEEKGAAEAAREETRRTLYASEMSAVQGRIESPFERSRAISTLQGWKPKPGSEEDDLRGWEWYFAMSQAIPDTETRIAGAAMFPRWSPDGKWISSVGRVKDSLSYAYCMKVFDAESGVLLKESAGFTFAREFFQFGSAWSPDGSMIAQSFGQALYVWGPEGSDPPRKVDSAGYTRLVAWSPDSKLLAIQIVDRSIQIWSSTGEAGTPPLMHLPAAGDKSWIGALRWSDDGNRVFAVTDSGIIYECDIASGKCREVRNLGEECVRWCWSGDGRLLAGVSKSSHKASVWDMTDPESLPRVIDCSGYFRAYIHNHKVVDFSPDNRYLALASWSRNTSVWEVETGRLVAVNADTHPVKMTQWSPDGSRLLSAGFHSVGDSKHWKPFASQREGFENVQRCNWSPDGIRLVTVGSHEVTVRKSVDMEVEATLQGVPEGGALDVAVNPDNRRIATLCRNGEVVINDLQTGEMIETLDFAARSQTGDPKTRGEISINSRIQWSPDGRVLGVAKGSLLLWDMLAAKIVFENHPKGWWDGYHNLVFHPELDLVAAVAFGGIEVWNYRSGEQLFELNHTISSDFFVSNYTPIAWSPDGKALAVADSRGVFIIPFDGGKWDATARYRNFTHFGGGEITGIQWGMDSKRVYSTSENHTLCIWLADSGREVHVINDVDAAKMDPLGLRIAAVGAGGLRILDASPAYEKDLSPKALPLLDARLAHNPDSIPDLVTRGKIAIHQGRLDDAARDLRRVEALFARQIAANPGDRVAIVRRTDFSNAMAAIYLETGHQDEALKVREEIFTFSRKVLGPEHPDTLTAMSRLAHFYRDPADRKDEAFKMQEEVLAISRKALGPDHPGTITAIYHLELFHRGTGGSREEAYRLAEEILAIRRKALGPQHPDTLYAMWSLWLTKSGDVSRRSEGITLLEETLTLSSKVLGPDHGLTRAAKNALTRLYLAEGPPEEKKLRFLEEAVKRRPGKPGVRVLSLKEPTVTELLEAGKISEVIALLEESSAKRPDQTLLGIQVAALQIWTGKDDDHAATSRRMLDWAADKEDSMAAAHVAKIVCLRPVEDPAMRETALALARKALELRDENQPANPWHQLALGIAEYRSGRFKEAEASLLAVQNLIPAGRTKAEVIEGTANLYLAMSLFQQGKPDEARSLFTATEAKMKPLPADETNPLAEEGTNHDDLILWLTYKEAKTLLANPHDNP